MQAELVAWVWIGTRAVVAGCARMGAACGNELAVGEHDRIAVVTTEVGRRSAGMNAARAARREVVDRDRVGIAVRWRGHGDDLPGRVRVELRRVDGYVAARHSRVLGQLQPVLGDVLVRPRARTELDEVRIVAQAAVEVADQLMATNVVDRLLAAAVLVEHPRQEQVDRVTVAGRGVVA